MIGIICGQHPPSPHQILDLFCNLHAEHGYDSQSNHTFFPQFHDYLFNKTNENKANRIISSSELDGWMYALYWAHKCALQIALKTLFENLKIPMFNWKKRSPICMCWSPFIGIDGNIHKTKIKIKNDKKLFLAIPSIHRNVCELFYKSSQLDWWCVLIVDCWLHM